MVKVNEKERIFDTFTKSQGLGGIYLPNEEQDYDNLYITMLEASTKYIEEIRMMHPKLPKVNVYYVDNEHVINACAFKTNSEYFIAINTGVVVKLKEIFDVIFKSNKLYDNDLFRESEQNLLSPKFMYFSMMFLVCHEYSHIRFGHCDLIYHLWGTSISEITSNCLIDDGIFLQTLELDSDCCTIANITNRILIINKGDIQRVSDDLGQWMLSCYILFKIFDNGEHTVYENYDLDNLAKLTHPRPGMRQNYLLSNIATLLLKHFDDSEVDKIFDRVLLYIQKFESTINDFVNLKKLEIGISYTSKGNEHLIRISNNWEKVREMLEPYTHDELAPFEEVNFTPKLID